MNKTKVLLVDPNTFSRFGLRTLLEKSENYEIEAELRCGTEAIDFVKRTSSDLFIISLVTLNMNGIVAGQAIKQRDPGFKIIIVSNLSNKLYEQSTLRAGLDGYIGPSIPIETVPSIVDKVVNGKIAFSHQLLRNELRCAERPNNHPRLLIPEITNREMQVLSCIAEGLHNKKIADLMHITCKTVENHRQNLLKKTRTHNAVQLLKYANERGMVFPNSAVLSTNGTNGMCV